MPDATGAEWSITFPPMTISLGARFGRYQIVQELGRGAMGVVYQARDPQIDRLVAIKTISLDNEDTDDVAAFRARFFHEAKAAGRLSHPGIVQIYDVGEDPDARLPYIVMEFVAGRSLNHLINHSGGKLPLRRGLAFAEQIAEALAYAHSQGVIHRDIKPSNILVTEDGRAKISDFGVARLDRSTMTLPGQLLGTPSYMAPEQLTGGPVDGRADLFSLGVMLYLLLSGHKPFQGSGNSTIRYKVVHRDPVPVSALDLEISPELAAVVRRAMEKDPDRRYQTGSEMALALQRLPDPEETSCRHEVAQEPTDEQGRSSYSLVSMLAYANAPKWAVTGSDPFGAAAPSPSVPAKPVVVKVNRCQGKRAVLALCGLVALLWTGYSAMRMRARPIPASDSSPPSISAVVKESKSATVPEAPVASVKRSSATPMPVVKRNGGTHAAPNENALPKVAPRRESASLTPQAPEASKPVAQTGAALLLEIVNPFDEAGVQIWVDNQLAYNQGLRADEKRRVGLFGRAQMHVDRINVSAGEHRIRVRIQSSSSSFDESRLVSQSFALNQEHKLQIKCDKRTKDLRLRFD